MNGLSFAEFENSSFDDLYSKGFANAKHLEQVSKELQHLKPGAPAALSFGRTAQAVDAAPLHARADTAQVRRLPTPAAARDPRADRGAAVDRGPGGTGAGRFRWTAAMHANVIGRMVGRTQTSIFHTPAQPKMFFSYNIYTYIYRLYILFSSAFQASNLFGGPDTWWCLWGAWRKELMRLVTTVMSEKMAQQLRPSLERGVLLFFL
ncbi:unnamed protein product [Durusdinium trenchii]|uniref:Uncharacterized protein n=1 Tax=Durusdinium trenchii TaxID=1381693 RepID=A0ABP0QKE7_9DINO